MDIQSDDLIELVQENHKTVLERYAKMQKELGETKAALDETKSAFVELEQKASRKGGGFGGQEEVKSLGHQVVESEGFKTFMESGARGMQRIEVKTVNTITTSVAAGMVAPQIDTTPVLYPRRRMRVRNLIAPGQTGSNAIWFSRMTARQSLAATVAEGVTKPQSDATFAQLQSPVQTIAHWIKASRQAMDDAPSLASTIDSELTFGVQLAEEAQLLSGDGTGTNLLGIIPQATAYSAAFSVTGETAIDRISLAILQAELAFLPASGIVLNSTDWRKIQMLKDGMGRYLFGDPASKTPPVLWGLDVVPTTAIASGTFLVGAFETASQIYDRLAMEVLISTENVDDFVKNLITIRGEERLALVVRQPAAFITGSLP